MGYDTYMDMHTLPTVSADVDSSPRFLASLDDVYDPQMTNEEIDALCLAIALDVY
jgi:hypothetical protein